MTDERPELEQVLEHYGLRAGFGRQAFMSNCPFHEDRTPSLSVSLDKQVWKCHSCGKSGDAYTMIMQMEDIDFASAKTFGATRGFTTSTVGGSDSDIPEGAYFQRRRVAKKKGDRTAGRRYVPAWRRD